MDTNEKHTKYTIVRKLKSKKASHVADTVIVALIPFKRNIHSITTDNGTEFADHKKIADKLNTVVYFAHPYCSWEKGAIKMLICYIDNISLKNCHLS